MIKKIKVGLIVFMGACVLTAMFSACAMGGRARSPEQQGGQQQGQNLQQQGQNLQQQGQNLKQQGLDMDNTPNTMPKAGQNLGQNEILGGNPENNQGSNPQANLLNQQTTEQQMAPDGQKAENIKNQLNQMKEIEDVNVVVMGNTALVGCKPSGNAKDINAVKEMIVKKVKEADKSITNVTVSEKTDIMEMISKLENDIKSNNPVDQITKEFNRIIQKITPSA